MVAEAMDGTHLVMQHQMTAEERMTGVVQLQGFQVIPSLTRAPGRFSHPTFACLVLPPRKCGRVLQV